MWIRTAYTQTPTRLSSQNKIGTFGELLPLFSKSISLQKRVVFSIMRRQDLISDQPTFKRRRDATLPSICKISPHHPRSLHRHKVIYQALGLEKARKWLLISDKQVSTLGDQDLSISSRSRKTDNNLRPDLLFFASAPEGQCGQKQPGWIIQEGGLFVSQMKIFDELEEELQKGWRRREESRGVPTTCLSGCRYTREEGKASKVNETRRWNMHVCGCLPLEMRYSGQI